MSDSQRPSNERVGPRPTVPKTLTTDEMLHILRNPWVHTHADIKRARLEAADEIQTLSAMLRAANERAAVEPKIDPYPERFRIVMTDTSGLNVFDSFLEFPTLVPVVDDRERLQRLCDLMNGQSTEPPSATLSDAERNRLRALVDDVWNAATDSREVPSYDWADEIIDKWFAGSTLTKGTEHE